MYRSTQDRTNAAIATILPRYIITRPPSTPRTWPVMNAASSLARNATAFAISSVVPNRRERRPVRRSRP